MLDYIDHIWPQLGCKYFAANIKSFSMRLLVKPHGS